MLEKGRDIVVNPGLMRKRGRRLGGMSLGGKGTKEAIDMPKFPYKEFNCWVGDFTGSTRRGGQYEGGSRGRE